MPTISGVSHISLSVSDAEDRRDGGQTYSISPDRSSERQYLRHPHAAPASRTIIEFQQHDGNTGEAFDPRRTGFDHMGFKVETRAALDEWLTRFQQLGITHSPIADHDYGSVLTFKDPDGIQFEMFYKVDHPQH